MGVKVNLESKLDRLFGLTDLPGSAGDKRSGLKFREEVETMDTPMKREKGWLRDSVLAVIEHNPSRAWAATEISKQIKHNNLDSINSTLSDLHRSRRFPVTRVAPGRYRYEVHEPVSGLVGKVTRITKGDTLRAGDLLEVVFVRGEKVLAIDSDDNLLVISARTVENF